MVRNTKHITKHTAAVTIGSKVLESTSRHPSKGPIIAAPDHAPLYVPSRRLRAGPSKSAETQLIRNGQKSDMAEPAIIPAAITIQMWN